MGEEEFPRKQHANDLPEDVLLWEILPKLQSPKDIIRCTTVCRRWKFHIQSPDFFYHPAFALIVNTPAPNKPLREPHYATDERTFNDWEGFKLRYLPCFNRRNKHPVCVQASCADLLLCTRSYKAQMVFYVVNPFTFEWTQLPQRPSGCPNWTFPVGLVAKLQRTPDEYRYRVARMTCMHPDWIRFEEFDSEVCCWYVKCIRQPQKKPPNWERLTRYQGLAFKGALHWLAEDGPVLVHDPFDGQNQCKYIRRHRKMYHRRFENATVTECLTISQGRLWMVQLHIFRTCNVYGNESHRVTIWKLKDYEESKWVVWRRLYFKDMVCHIPWLREYMHDFIEKHTKYKMTESTRFSRWFHTDDEGAENPENREVVHIPQPLACHPTKTHLVYLHLPHSIALCDMLTKKLEIVSKMNSQQVEPHYYDTVVPITLQSPPTSLPPLDLEKSSLSRYHKLGFSYCPF